MAEHQAFFETIAPTTRRKTRTATRWV